MVAHEGEETWLGDHCKNPSHADNTEILSRGEESACEGARRVLAALFLPPGRGGEARHLSTPSQS
jgi:hypothetical protein